MIYAKDLAYALTGDNSQKCDIAIQLASIGNTDALIKWHQLVGFAFETTSDAFEFVSNIQRIRGKWDVSLVFSCFDKLGESSAYFFKKISVETTIDMFLDPKCSPYAVIEFMEKRSSKTNCNAIKRRFIEKYKNGNFCLQDSPILEEYLVNEIVEEGGDVPLVVLDIYNRPPNGKGWLKMKERLEEEQKKFNADLVSPPP